MRAQPGSFYGDGVALVAHFHGVQVVGETDVGDSAMAKLDEVFCADAASAFVFDQKAVELSASDRTI